MKRFVRLEYRLSDDSSLYPAIYHYSQLDSSEFFCRRICDFFIKNRKIYRKTSSSREQDLFVIYLEEEMEEVLFEHAPHYSHVTLEIRLFSEEEESRLMETLQLESHDEVLEYIGNDFIQFGEYEFEKVSTEIDEDRSAYVLYVKATGYKLSL